jgi:hypothetical protein
MDASGQLSTRERSDVKRNIAQTSQVATRSTLAVSPKGNPTASFFEVAAQVSAGPPRSINVPDSKRVKTEKKAEKNFNLWENSKMGFGDFVDIINPLQHIPIVATIYRNRTGDTLGFASRVIGGALWGRIGGFVSGAVNGVVNWLTGKDIGDHIYSAFFGNSGESQRSKMVTNSVESPTSSSMIHSMASPAMFEAAETMESAFGDFDDDGGFSVAGRASKAAQSLALRSTSSAIPAALAALNSYEQNIDLDASKEPFRFRFPA